MFKFIKMLKRSDNTESRESIARRLVTQEKGATAIEYGLIAALIAVAAVGAMTSLGTGLNKTFNNVTASLVK